MRSGVTLTSLSGRVDRAPLIAHCVALLLAALALALVVDVERGVYDADEGALLMQVRVLTEEKGWFIDLPTADLDPEGWFAAVAHAHIGDGTIAPFPVRPVMVGVTARLWRAGGVFLATVPGILGLVVAAAVAADLARRIDTRARTLTFWLAGIASPMVFQALALQGHGPAVGLAALMLWCASTAPPTPNGRLALYAGGAAAASLAAALYRREILVLAVSLIAASCVVAVRERNLARPLVALAALAGATAGTAIDQTLAGRVFSTGPRSTPLGSSAASSFLSDRISAGLSMISPGYEGDPTMARVLVLVASAILILAAIRFRRRGDAVELVVAACIAAALLMLRLVISNRYMVQGIVPAFPLAIAVLVTLARRTDDLLRDLLWVCAVVFLALTAATQYSFGGGFEWASRYVTVGLPAILPLVGVGLLSLRDRLDETPRLVAPAVGAVAILALAPAAMGVIAQHHARRTNANNGAAVHELALAAGVDVVLSTHPQIPRATPRQLWSPLKWLWVPPEYLEVVLPRVAQSGRTGVLLVTREPEEALEALDALSWRPEVVRVQDENPGRAVMMVATLAGRASE